MTCLLCRGDSREVGQVATEDLVWLYRSRLGLGVSGSFGDLKHLSLNQCDVCGLCFFSPQVPAAPDVYSLLQDRPFYHQVDRREFERAATYTAGKRVLDVGGGTGAASAALGASMYVGLETNMAAIRSASEKGVEVRFETIQEHSLERPGYYDAVCAFQVLEHVPDPRSFLQECLATLREGGFLILSVPAQDSFISALPNNPLNLPPHHLTWWPDSSMRKVAEIWDLEMVVLQAEGLEPVHRRWYAANLCRMALCSLIGFSPRPIVDRRIVFRALESLGWRLSWFLGKGINDTGGLTRGHTLTAVYRKPRLAADPAHAQGW